MTWLLSIVGTPAPILYATLNVVRTLAQIALGNHMVVVANSVAALRVEFRTQHREEANPLVLFRDYPHKDLLASLVSAKAPVSYMRRPASLRSRTFPSFRAISSA